MSGSPAAPVLVTGAAGFIGRHVVAVLRERGHAVRGLDVAESAGRGDDVVADVRDRAAVDAALAGVGTVVHLAAKVGLGVDLQDMPDYCDVNVTGTATLLAAMAATGTARLVVASSMVVYGEGAYSCAVHGGVPAPPRTEKNLSVGSFEPRCLRCGGDLDPELVTEDAPADPRNAYALSKLAQEHLAATWARGARGTATALRFHNVYGPGMPRDTPYAGVAAIFASALARGAAPQVHEDGRQRRDFVHVRDVARAVAAAVDAAALPPGSLRAYNVGSGTPRTVGDLAAALSAAVDGPAPELTGDYRLGDVRHVTASSARITAELGWRAEVPFDEGVGELARELVMAVRGAAGGRATRASRGP